MGELFELNGDQFDVDVVSLEREFNHGPEARQEQLLDGQVHYEPKNAYCHYTMTVRARPGMEQALNDLWEYLMIPMVHQCSFPYGSTRINQKMFVTGGKQSLLYDREDTTRWGELTVHLIAAEPRRTPW